MGQNFSLSWSSPAGFSGYFTKSNNDFRGLYWGSNKFLINSSDIGLIPIPFGGFLTNISITSIPANSTTGTTASTTFILSTNNFANPTLTLTYPDSVAAQNNNNHAFTVISNNPNPQQNILSQIIGNNFVQPSFSFVANPFYNAEAPYGFDGYATDVAPNTNTNNTGTGTVSIREFQGLTDIRTVFSTASYSNNIGNSTIQKNDLGTYINTITTSGGSNLNITVGSTKKILKINGIQLVAGGMAVASNTNILVSFQIDSGGNFLFSSGESPALEPLTSGSGFNGYALDSATQSFTGPLLGGLVINNNPSGTQTTVLFPDGLILTGIVIVRPRGAKTATLTLYYGDGNNSSTNQSVNLTQTGMPVIDQDLSFSLLPQTSTGQEQFVSSLTWYAKTSTTEFALIDASFNSNNTSTATRGTYTNPYATTGGSNILPVILGIIGGILVIGIIITIIQRRRRKMR